MWALNYIKHVSVGGSRNDIALLSTYDANGALMFFKTYWKQKFNYEIKLHGGLDDIHDDIYITDMPYIAGQFTFLLV